jgi:hypothetical protein
MNGISCCHVAVALALANIIQLVCFFGYNLKLDGRTAKLEKKNGHEQKQLNELKEKVKQLEKLENNHA